MLRVRNETLNINSEGDLTDRYPNSLDTRRLSRAVSLGYPNFLGIQCFFRGVRQNHKDWEKVPEKKRINTFTCDIIKTGIL